EAFCLACRFDDYPVGQAQVAFRADATKLYSILTPIYEERGASVNVSDRADTLEEDILAFYTQYQVKTDFLSRPATITAGLRYERTDVSSSVTQTVPTGIRWIADNDFVIDFGNETDTFKGKGKYNHLLPNIDLRVDVTDSVVARMSYSET